MKRIILLPLLIFLALPVFAQERFLNVGLSNDEQYAFVGMTLAEVIESFGPPRAVSVARGIELWQDDVVFQYTGVDFYIYRDRVWQVRFNATHGIANGDLKAAVLLTLGDTAQDMGEHITMSIGGKNWPLTLRINLNDAGRVAAIYLYRPDFN